MKGKDGKTAVIAGTVTDDVRMATDLPAMKVCALKFTAGARARITASGGSCITFDQLALQDPKAANCVLLRGAKTAREANKHFGHRASVNSIHTHCKVKYVALFSSSFCSAPSSILIYLGPTFAHQPRRARSRTPVVAEETVVSRSKPERAFFCVLEFQQLDRLPSVDRAAGSNTKAAALHTVISNTHWFSTIYYVPVLGCAVPGRVRGDIHTWAVYATFRLSRPPITFWTSHQAGQGCDYDSPSGHEQRLCVQQNEQQQRQRHLPLV